MVPNKNSMNEDEARLLGFQALIFEMNWPSFRWIRAVFAQFSPKSVALWIEYSESPPISSLEACSAMFKEIFEVVYGDRNWKLTLDYRPAHPNSADFQIVMCDEIFKRLAKEVAPWRLGEGR